MPSFCVMSLFDHRKQKYAEKISQGRQELADFLASLESQFGRKTAGVVRAYAEIPSHR
jgi:hypothetical protein